MLLERRHHLLAVGTWKLGGALPKLQGSRRTSPPRLDLHPEPVLGVDCGACAGSHVLRVSGGRCELEGEVAEHHGQRSCPLQHGEDIPHALARSSAKWDKCVIAGNLVWVQTALPLCWVVPCPTRHLWVLVGPQEALRIVGVWIGPVGLRALQVVHGDEEVHAPKHLRLLPGATSRQRVLLQGPADQQRGLRVHAQGLCETKPYQLHFLDVLICGVLLTAEDLVNLMLHFLHERGVLRQLKEGPCQSGSCRLVPSDQHGDHIVTQLLA
mmetsp:Transcript_20402/g.56360  ORF Transcript_20402/g.56360 Transcript_20402/m.56360 type:complete len:268 (-) Transcript_20402:1301-2104(-)